jgi:hypothetical protein
MPTGPFQHFFYKCSWESSVLDPYSLNILLGLVLGKVPDPEWSGKQDPDQGWIIPDPGHCRKDESFKKGRRNLKKIQFLCNVKRWIRIQWWIQNIVLKYFALVQHLILRNITFSRGTISYRHPMVPVPDFSFTHTFLRKMWIK